LGLATEMAKASVDRDEDVLSRIFAFIHGDSERGREAMDKWRVAVVKAPPSVHIP
jgi:hypothetical protein